MVNKVVVVVSVVTEVVAVVCVVKAAAVVVILYDTGVVEIANRLLGGDRETHTHFHSVILPLIQYLSIT